MKRSEKFVEEVARTIHARFLFRASNGNPNPDEVWDHLLTERARDEYRTDAHAVLDTIEILEKDASDHGV
ncbi:hypothetical protein [Saccharopolyspora griseoalba]|uniref:Uncharacterized protein n=1 Tax=Saccharopolyspora griseoalba TaxID=1431848 RepID=A0ABW2LUV2_9PSEU